MTQLWPAIGWFVGVFAFLTISTPLMLQKVIWHYSEPEQEGYSGPEIDIWSIDLAFYRRLFNINFLVATTVSSALAAFGMTTESPDRFVAGAIFGIVANALLGWRVITKSAPEIAEEFGYTLKRR